MAEDVDTGNGRHWSGPVEPPVDTEDPSAPTPADNAGDLPVPPPTTVTPPAPRWGEEPPTAPPRPPLPPRAEHDRPSSEAVPPPTPWGAAPQMRPRQPMWEQPAAASQPPAGAPPQWGSAPPQPGQAEPPPRLSHPSAAPRRPQTEPAGQVSVDPRLRQAGPDRRPAADRGAVEADQYRRPGAPMQAAYAGIQQELIATAAEERHPVATTGWRGAANAIGFKLAPSKKERRRREVLRRIRAPKDSMYAIAVLTLKGGAGKTTVTAALGQVFAAVRPDAVLAVDADPDAGDLPLRTAVHPRGLSMMEMLDEEFLGQHDIVQRFLSTTDTDLQVLANGWRPDSNRVVEPADISDVHEIASHYYSMLLWDGDKALNSPVVREVLAKSNALVLLVEASRPGAVKAGQAIDWLRNHGFEGLLARTVLLVNETTNNTRLDMKSLMTVLARQQLKIHHIPFDPHLDEGLAIDLDKLKKKTRYAFEDLAAMLADDFSVPQPPAHVVAAAAG